MELGRPPPTSKARAALGLSEACSGGGNEAGRWEVRMEDWRQTEDFHKGV